jgi:hypothetical protein
LQGRRSTGLSYKPVKPEQVMNVKKEQTNDKQCAYDQNDTSLRKKMEVIQPQVPLRLPCDDLTHLMEHKFELIKKLMLTHTPLEWFDGRGVQGAGTYSPEFDEL